MAVMDAPYAGSTVLVMRTEAATLDETWTLDRAVLVVLTDEPATVEASTAGSTVLTTVTAGSTLVVTRVDERESVSLTRETIPLEATNSATDRLKVTRREAASADVREAPACRSIVIV